MKLNLRFVFQTKQGQPMENSALKMVRYLATKKLLWVLATISSLNAISLVALEAWWMATLSLILSGMLINLSKSQPARYFRKLAILFCVVAMILAAPITLNQLSTGSRHIGNHAVQNGPKSLSYVARFGLWWSAIWMSIGGV